MLKKNRGFSLVELLLVVAMIGGVSLVVMQLSQNSAKIQDDAVSNQEYIELKNQVNFILSNANSCQASLRGLVFNGSTISTTPLQGIELWFGTQVGARSRRQFFSNQKYGKVTISSIIFKMPDYTAGTNFPEGLGSFYGILTLTGSKKRNGVLGTFSFDSQPVNIIFKTNHFGQSIIESCGSGPSASDPNLVGVYRHSCYWHGSPGSCAPNSCVPGDIDKGIGCDKIYDLWGGPSGYSGGNCYRTCFTKLPLPMVTYFHDCRNDNCSPPSCSSGDVERGVVSCFINNNALGGPSGTPSYSCRRHCFAPSPFSL